MSDRIHVTMALDLLIEDAEAMHQAAFERLRSAWSSDEDFPYESAADVPLDEVVHSLLADALPAELPGCRRSQLEVEVEARSGDQSQASSGEDSDDTNRSAAAGSEEGEREDDESDAEQRSTSEETDDARGSVSNEDESPAAKSSSEEPSSSEESAVDKSNDGDRQRDQ